MRERRQAPPDKARTARTSHHMQQSKTDGPTLAQCCANVLDVGPSLGHNWTINCSLRALSDKQPGQYRSTEIGEALLLAVNRDERGCLQALLDAGVDPNTMEEGYTPLLEAITAGKLHLVEQLLATPNIDVNLQSSHFGSTPLQKAVQHDKTAVLALLKAGANVNKTDRTDTSALMVATQLGDEDLVKLLLDHGADVKHTDRQGRTALGKAVSFAHVSCQKILLEAGSDSNVADKRLRNSILHYAVSNHHDDDDATERLLKAGASPNVSNAFGVTPLVEAVRRGYVGCVRVLLKYKALVIDDRQITRSRWRNFLSGNCQTDFTPLHCCATLPAATNTHQIMLMLLRAGSSVNLEDPSGKNACSKALANWRLANAMLLLQAGSSVEQCRFGLGLLDCTGQQIKQADQQLIRTLTQLSSSPHSLQLLCLCEVRALLGRHLQEKASLLGLPTALTESLLFTDLEPMADMYSQYCRCLDV